MKKTICALFFVFICLFSSFGNCYVAQAENEYKTNVFEKNAFRVVRRSDENDKILLSYIFPVNEELLKKQKFSDNEIKTLKFYLTTYVNALAKTNKEKETEGASVGSCVYFTDVDGLGFTITFDNLEAQKRYFGVEDQEDNNKRKNEMSGFFMKKLEIKTAFPISSTKSAGDLKLICVMAITSWCDDNNISSERKSLALQNLNESLYIYDFSTQENSLKSDVMYQAGEVVHNVFVKTLSDIESDNQIKFWIVVPNRPVWYMSALVIVLVGMFVVFIFYKKKKIKNAGKNK